MNGLCPICDMGDGLHPMKGKTQKWTDPRPAAINVPEGVPVPSIMMGTECGHTVSEKNFLAHNKGEFTCH
jgi:hypothetical protein